MLLFYILAASLNPSMLDHKYYNESRTTKQQQRKATTEFGGVRVHTGSSESQKPLGKAKNTDESNVTTCCREAGISQYRFCLHLVLLVASHQHEKQAVYPVSVELDEKLPQCPIYPRI